MSAFAVIQILFIYYIRFNQQIFITAYLIGSKSSIAAEACG